MSNSAFTPAVLTIPAAATTATGELNVISNPSAASLSTTGWTGVTAVGTNSPLNPTVTTAFSIANTAGAESSTSGGYASFTMPSGLQNKKLKVEFYFTTPATDVYKVSVYKSGSRVTLTTDSSGSTTLPASTTGKFVAYFDTDTTANWTVNITRTSGSTGPIYVTNVIVGPGIQPQGAVVGEWQISTTPTVGGLGSKGLSSSSFRYRRVGSNMELYFQFIGNNTASGTGTTDITFTIPDGYTRNTTIATSGDATSFGAVQTWGVTSAGVYDYATVAIPGATNNTVRFVKPNANANYVTSDLNVSRNIQFEGFLTIPIAEWAGSGTVQLAQNDVEWAYNTTAWGTDNTSSNFGYGPGGASITGALSASLTQRVTFQTPVQVGDDLAVEISSDGKIFRRADTFMDASGNPVINSYSSLATGNSSAGVYLKSVSGITTQLDVVFMRYASLANDDSPVVDWQNGWKWRVRKSSAGAAVGFGIVSSSSAGLLPVSNANLDDATATRLGLKQYLHGTTYNGGNAPTVTCSQTNFAVARAVFVPYQTQDGAWRLRFNMSGTFTSATITQVSYTVNGITSKNVTNYVQGVIAATFNGAGITEIYIASNSNVFQLKFASSAQTGAYFSGDIELESKPTWAY